MPYYSLPFGKLHKKTRVTKLKNLPSNFENDFYKNWLDNVDSSFDLNFQRKIVSEAPNENVKNYLLATSKFGKCMQEDINLYITRDRLNEASFRRKLDPIAKNAMRRQNPLELNFKDISIFEVQNSLFGSLVR